MPEANNPRAMENAGAPGEKRKKTIAIIILVVLILVAVAAFFAIRSIQQQRKLEEAQRQAIINSGVFHEGIFVENINVGGKTIEQALDLLLPAEKKIKSGISFSLFIQDNEVLVAADDLGLVFNTRQVLETAFSICRTGSLEELTEELANIAANKRHFSISYDSDEAALEDYAAKLAEQYNQLPSDAGYAVTVERATYDDPRQLDKEFVIAAAIKTPDECIEYTPEINGLEIQQQALVDSLRSMIKTMQYSDLEVALETTPANITLENIQEAFTLRGSAYTSFAKAPYNRDTRVYNIQKAVSLINGYVLLPGEEFSTNGTLGNRTYAGGWEPAPAIVRGRSEDQAGGGVCQVSSTMYNAVLKADLEITYRQGHSGRLSYVDGGLDATIDSGRIDFKWKNNTSSPIYIFARADMTEQRVYFEIYGEPFPEEYDEIKLSSARIETLSPPGDMKYTIDYTKPSGFSEVFVSRKSGSIWESYKAYLKDGVEVKKETLDRTTYKAYSGETIIGPPATTTPSGGGSTGNSRPGQGIFY
ncbi:VanW family protein [Eubacteriales bacterium OttesenSCG-928-K08]|nr:VanW family protein [Eubacteriales bacterium OttesenSCG-928-K08]